MTGLPIAGPAQAQVNYHEVHLPVALTEGGEKRYEVVGTLGVPASPIPSRVQLLLHGSTYGRYYWDFPLEPERYSYVRHMTNGGWATLALDRIGIGQSSHPPPDEVDVESNAFVVHQVIQALRDGTFEGHSFSTVVLVGHSLGSAITIAEASRYKDVDAVVVTGLLHHFDVGLVLVPASLYPAQEDNERFNGLPVEYTTTRPGERSLFYHAPTVDPKVISADEGRKETVTAAEIATFPLDLARSRQIRVPVLVVVGDFDRVFCSLINCSVPLLGGAAFESTFWTTKCYRQIVVPDAGHSINLHPNAATWYAQALAWLETNTGAATPERCRRGG